MRTAKCIECDKEFIVPARRVGPPTCSFECREDHLERKKLCKKCLEKPAVTAGYCRACYKPGQVEFIGPSDKAIRDYEERYGVKFPFWLQVDYVERRPDEQEVRGH